MSANWNNPTLSSLYTDVLSLLKERDADLAVQFDGVSPTNIPTGAVRWNSAISRWQKWSGSAWGELATTYALTALSTTGNAAIGGNLTVAGTSAFTGAVTVPTPTATGHATTKTYVDTALALKANLASPSLTGTPTAPTAAVDTNTTQLATTAFVIGQAYAKLASPTFTGTLTAANLTATGTVSLTGTGAATLNKGTTAQRPSGASGMIRFNTTDNKFEGYNGTAWGTIGGGATGGGSDDVFYENAQTVSSDYTITANKNAMSAGPITIASGVTVTVPDGSEWTIV